MMMIQPNEASLWIIHELMSDDRELLMNNALDNKHTVDGWWFNWMKQLNLMNNNHELMSDDDQGERHQHMNEINEYASDN